MSAEEITALIQRRMESRYRRIKFVHEELSRLNQKASQRKAGDPASFEDFAFNNADFSVYQKIPVDEFELLYVAGLEDFAESFYQKAFKANREKIRDSISRSYIKVGPFYVLKKANPLILSIMRSLHTSLEFAPLLAAADFAGNGALSGIIAALDGVVIRHDDGAQTKLRVKDAVLTGIFYPFGKAFTVTLM
jgi:hypothetical protein